MPAAGSGAAAGVAAGAAAAVRSPPRDSRITAALG